MRNPIHNAMARLAGAEGAFLANDFLAPVLRGRGVMVRIAGVRCNLAVKPADFEGFGVFRPESLITAKFRRDATANERRRYLELFAAVRLVVCARSNKSVVASDGSDSVTISLTDDCDLFDTLIARFDGVQYWFDEIDPRTDPAAASYLRQQLTTMRPPAELDRPGLTLPQRLAYATVHNHRTAAIEADEQQRGENRLAAALSQAGATLRDFTETHGAYRVNYSIDGARHTSLIRKSDLTVLSAGICLSGLDHVFDLNSLVGVMRERPE